MATTYDHRGSDLPLTPPDYDCGYNCGVCDNDMGRDSDDDGSREVCEILGVTFPSHHECLVDFVKENPKFYALVADQPGFEE